MELPDPVQLVIVRRQPVGMSPAGLAGTQVRPDGQWPELVEGEHPVREPAGDLLDHGQLRVPIGIVGLLPGLRAPEGDLVFVQELA